LLIPFFLEILIAFGWFFHVGHKIFFGQVSDNVAQASALPFPIACALVVMTILTIVAPLFALKLVGSMTF